MGFDLGTIREEFPALAKCDGNQRRIHLDNPGGTQVPRVVVRRMVEYLTESNANLGGFFTTTRSSAAVVGDARLAVADLLNAPSPEEIIFGQNMTTLTLHVSRSIGRHFNPGDEIVLSSMDHEGNISPWLAMARDHDLVVKWLPFDTETFEFDLHELSELLSDRTRLVCIGAASNMLGTINDIKTVSAMARAVGAWTYVDAVQAAPHIVLDVQDVGCDFLVCSAYKFFGPHQGVLWGRREVLEQLEPYKVRPASNRIPDCFETGTQNHEGMAGTTGAIDYFAWVGDTMGSDFHERHQAFSGRRRFVRAGLDLLFQYEMQLAGHLIAGLQQLPGVRILGITADDSMHRRVPTIAFTVAGHTPAKIARALAARNVFVWSGHYYAVEAAKALGIHEQGGAVRVGPVHYNSKTEIDEFLNILGEVCR